MSIPPGHFAYFPVFIKKGRLDAWGFGDKKGKTLDDVEAGISDQAQAVTGFRILKTSNLILILF